MSANLINALQISVIGMGLVFGAILLLMLVITILVRVTQLKDVSENKTGEADLHLKYIAAAAAVAFALEDEANQAPKEFPLPPTAVVSPWQSVMRSNILKKRGSIR